MDSKANTILITTTLDVLTDEVALFELFLRSASGTQYRFYIKSPTIKPIVNKLTQEIFLLIETNLRKFKIRRFQLIVNNLTYSSDEWKYRNYYAK